MLSKCRDLLTVFLGIKSIPYSGISLVDFSHKHILVLNYSQLDCSREDLRVMIGNWSCY